MSGLISRWRELIVQYRAEVSLGRDYLDIVSALLFTLGALSFGIGVAALFGGSNG